MKTIVLVTFETSPYKGSEASVSWNYITHMSPFYNLIVVYGKGNADVDEYLKHQEMLNVDFVNVSSKEIGHGRGLLYDIKYNIAYKEWHKDVFKTVQSILRERHVDVVHYLNPIGFKEPGYLWRLDVPYVWGPIQTVANRPFALYPALNVKGKINAFTRFIVHNSLLRFHPRVRIAMKKSDFIFAAVPKAKEDLRTIYHRDAVYLPENGIIKMNSTTPISYDAGEFRMIWIGSIDDRKALIILLEALRNVQSNKWRLDVVGKGYLEDKMKAIAIKYGINERINWMGSVPRTQVFETMKHSHLHVISSLGEGNPTTLWEAMSLAVPTMTLDHCGMSAVVCERCGIKIPIRSYKQVVNDMASQIENLILNPERVVELSKGVLKCAKKFMWDKRIAIYDEVYDRVIEKQ